MRNNSELPWYVDSDTDITDSAGAFVATTHAPMSDVGTQQEYDNAALIALAVNCHAELISALEKAEKLIRGMGNIIRDMDSENDYVEFWNQDDEYVPGSEYAAIRAAISKARQA